MLCCHIPFLIISKLFILFMNKGNNKITELRTIFQRESQNSSVYKQTKSVNNRKTKKKKPYSIESIISEWSNLQHWIYYIWMVKLTALNLLHLNSQPYSIESITSEWSNLQHWIYYIWMVKLTALNLLHLNGQTYSIESITSEWSTLQHWIYYIWIVNLTALNLVHLNGQTYSIESITSE